MSGPPLFVTLGFFILTTLGLAGLGVAMPDRRPFFFAFSALIGFMTILMIIVFWIVFRMIPQ